MLGGFIDVVCVQLSQLTAFSCSLRLTLFSVLLASGLVSTAGPSL